MVVNQETIQKQAKEILDKFSKELDKVKEQVGETFVEREEDRREEGEGKEGDSYFRETMLKNAPSKEGDFIVAEKGKWVK